RRLRRRIAAPMQRDGMGILRTFQPDRPSPGRRARRPRAGRRAPGPENQPRAGGTVAMNTTIAILAVATLLISGGIARAGVGIDEQVTTTRGSEPPTVQQRQLLVQGHQEKMVSDHNSFVIDLDKGTMMLIDPKQKAYAEMPFPPHEPAANPQQLGLNFQKTGKSST